MSAGIKPADAGSVLRLHTTARENARTRARRLLVEGRVMVRYCGPRGVQAYVRGSGALRHVIYELGRGWSCTCPALTPHCSHVLAVQQVVIVKEER